MGLLLRVLLKSAALLLLLCGVSLYFFFIKDDISTTPVHLRSEGQPTPPVYLISYADGPKVFLQNQNALAASAINKGIDFIFNYRHEHLDPGFVKEHIHILEQKKGAGYWLWKPWIILHTLETVPENAVVFYADSGLVLRQSVQPLIDLVAKYDMILVEDSADNLPLGPRTKREAFVRLNCDTPECRSARVINAYFLVLRNTETTRLFIKKWLDVCCDENLLTDTLSAEPEHPGSVCHSHDQSLLGILCYLEPEGKYFLKLDEFSPYVCWHHRHPYAYNKIHVTTREVDARETDSLFPYLQNNPYLFVVGDLLLNNRVTAWLRTILVERVL